MRRASSLSGGSEAVAMIRGDSRSRCGGALWEAQTGGKAGWAKPLKGFSGAGVLVVVDDHDGGTYRTVYTVRFAGVVYVLRVF